MTSISHGFRNKNYVICSTCTRGLPTPACAFAPSVALVSQARPTYLLTCGSGSGLRDYGCTTSSPTRVHAYRRMHYPSHSCTAWSAQPRVATIGAALAECACNRPTNCARLSNRVLRIQQSRWRAWERDYCIFGSMHTCWGRAWLCKLCDIKKLGLRTHIS